MNSRMRASLAVDALEDAWQRRGKPRDVIMHSDRGSQFGSRQYIEACRATGIHRSMGQAYTCADNAAMESFFSLLQKNVLNQRSHWPDITTLKARYHPLDRGHVQPSPTTTLPGQAHPSGIPNNLRQRQPANNMTTTQGKQSTNIAANPNDL